MRTLLSTTRPYAAGFAALLLATSLASPLAAAATCMRPAEKAAFAVVALKSELMVTAISCQAEDQYKSFVVRFRSDLVSGERGINNYFSRTAGKHAQQAHDDYITTLANTQSEDGLRQGTDFCDKHLPMMTDVLALKDSTALFAYAVTAPLVQAIDTTECPPPVAKKPPAAASAPPASK